MRTRCATCAPWRPGRSGRRNSADGTSAPARDRRVAPLRRAWRTRTRQARRRGPAQQPQARSRAARARRPGSEAAARRRKWAGRSSGPVVSARSHVRRRAAIRIRAANRWEAGQRPARFSLGLLPSGPDPVGEWNVHRQPPAPYIGHREADYKPPGPGFRPDFTPAILPAGRLAALRKARLRAIGRFR